MQRKEFLSLMKEFKKNFEQPKDFNKDDEDLTDSYTFCADKNWGSHIEYTFTFKENDKVLVRYDYIIEDSPHLKPFFYVMADSVEVYYREKCALIVLFVQNQNVAEFLIKMKIKYSLLKDFKVYVKRGVLNL